MNSITRFLTILLAAACLLAGCASPAPETVTTAADTGVSSDVTTEEPAPETQPTAGEDDGWVSAIFTGGPVAVSKRTPIEMFTQTGFDTLLIWSIHVHADGDIYLNDARIVRNGKCEITGNMIDKIAQLRGGDSSVRRIELSIGAWGTPDFENIRDLISRDGTGPETELYRNFKVLIETFGADAVNYDDESCYDVGSTVAFSKMLLDMGLKHVTLCPYTYFDFWTGVKDSLDRVDRSVVDRVYVQCYDGGAGNRYRVRECSEAFGIRVIPGLWGKDDDPEAVRAFLEENAEWICGGFMWTLDEIKNYEEPRSARDYSSAIEAADPNAGK